MNLEFDGKWEALDFQFCPTHILYSIIVFYLNQGKKGKLRGAYMIWNYRGVGVLFAKKDKENNFVVCLGKRKWINTIN